jgi:uncharacterized protein (TIGR00269 family)
MQCDKCRSGAVIFQQYSGLHLCRKHFAADFEAKAKRAIRTHRWMKKNDHIAVALSGGKNSSALLCFLKALISERRDIMVSAITIDEGIPKYRNPSNAVRIAESLGADCVVASFRDAYGTGMEEIVAGSKERGSCLYCRVLRRTLLNRVACEQGVTRLATGYDLDDQAQSVLMDVLQGDALHLLRPQEEIAGMVPQIRPFMYIPKREVGLYAHLHVKGFVEGRCPYAHDTLRTDVNAVLNDYTLRHPSTKYSLVNLAGRFAQAGAAVKEEIQTCEHCREPCGGTCQSCRILKEVLGNAA